MVESPPPRPPRLVVEALGTGEIPGELSAILAGRFRTVRKDGAALLSDKLSVRGINSFLEQVAPGVDRIHGLERVTLVGIEPDEMVHLFHSLFSVPFGLYSTIQRLFAFRGEFPDEGLPLVV